MNSKNLLLILLFSAAVVSAQEASAGFPVRNWNDDMPRHTFSLEAGPGLFSTNNPFLDAAGLSTGDIPPLGFQAALRYDWSYLRGYEVAMGTGLTYIFSSNSSRSGSGTPTRGGVRLGETFHYIGINAVDTKIWFGKRTIWDVCIHMGYMGGSSWMNGDGNRQSVAGNGFMAGLSTGLDILVTAWLGVGVRLNGMTGVMYSGGSSNPLEYSSGALTVGAVYCF